MERVEAGIRGSKFWGMLESGGADGRRASCGDQVSRSIGTRGKLVGRCRYHRGASDRGQGAMGSGTM